MTAPEGPTLVLAGPGSGKTRVLTRRIAYHIRALGVNPRHILAVTFTNKAAVEMRWRVIDLLEAHEQPQGLQIGTFHAICARILRSEHAFTPYTANFLIYDTVDQVRVIENVANNMNVDTQSFNARALLYHISAAKNELITPSNYVANDYFSEVVARVYPEYQAFLQKNNAVDFDDLLMQTVLLLQHNETVRQKYQTRFQAVLVDEFQDTNTAQYQLVKLFAAPQHNVFVVGDEDQSIYAFRGADFRNVQRFRQDYPDATLVLLEQNYRSPQSVLDVARAVIDQNSHRTPKALFTTRKSGELLHLVETESASDEARYVAQKIQELHKHYRSYTAFAIMYRTNPQSRAFEKALREANIPYQLVGGKSFYERREVRDVLAYLRVISSGDRVSFLRIANVPKRGFGEGSIKQFAAWLDQKQLTIDDALTIALNNGDTPLRGRARNELRTLAQHIVYWRELAQEGRLQHLFDRLCSDISYGFYLQELSQTFEELEERWGNLNELREMLKQAEDQEQTLTEFLTEQSLMTDLDLERDEKNAVKLMTLHAAKGLEFPVVFIVGLEDELLPHRRALEEEGGIEEERRLFYVGITRTQERLFLTYAYQRALYGGYRDFVTPSRFLNALPAEAFEPKSRMLLSAMTAQNSKKTTWATPAPAPASSLSRLARDLRAQAQQTNPLGDKDSKIILFPTAKLHTRYRPNQSVLHPVFGLGVVVKSVLEDDDELVTVVFKNKQHGIKQFSASYAQLTVLE